MAMSYYERQRAIVNIGHALQKRGWHLVGYREDQSDSMTDYFCPANWSGVATHDKAPDVVVCVGVDGYHANKKSGKEELGVRYETVSTEPCHRCNGTGVWPDGATLEQARRNPSGQHAIEFAKENNQMLLMASAVSPLHYRADGLPKCLYCHGEGNKVHKRQVDYVRWTWPKFQETPRGRAWHVEKGGKIIGTGTGLNKVTGYGKEAEAPANSIADAIEALAFGKGKSKDETPKAASNGNETNSTPSGKIEVKHEGDWTWVKFPSKPPECVLEVVRGFGARWSKKRNAWYIQEHIPAHEVVTAIVAAA